MRAAIINGNGHYCDKCGETLYPEETIHIKALKLSEDPDKAAQGVYNAIGKMHLCDTCYTVLQMTFCGFSQPRKKRKTE